MSVSPAPLRSVSPPSPRDGVLEGWENTAEHVGTLLGIGATTATTEDFIASVVPFLWDALSMPTAGWSRSTAGDMRLVAAEGIDEVARNSLAGLRGSASAIARQGRELLGTSLAVVEASGGAAIVLRSEEHPHGTLDAVIAGLHLSLGRLADAESASAVRRSADVGLAATAHELRAPLLAVDKAIGTVIRRSALDQASAEMLQRAHNEVRTLAASVDLLLRTASNVSPPPRRRPSDLAAIVRNVVASLSERPDRPVRMEVRAEVQISGYPALLRAAISNVVRNALEHGAGEIVVVVDRDARRALVQVVDQGPGVSPEETSTVFQPFIRGGLSRTRSTRGAGLGLFIVRRAIEAHGGDVRFSSTDQGAVVELRIPVKAA